MKQMERRREREGGCGEERRKGSVKVGRKAINQSHLEEKKTDKANGERAASSSRRSSNRRQLPCT